MKIARFPRRNGRVIAATRFQNPRGRVRLRFTHVLAIVIIAVFAIELAFPALIDIFAFSPAEFAARPWSVLTAPLVHADLEHLIANLFALWFFGLAVEKELGCKKALGAFLAGALLGEVAAAFLYSLDTLSLGASAGIFALIGVAALVRPFELDVGGWPMASPLPLVLLAMIYAAYNALGMISGPSDVAYGAHFAGLAVGLMFGYFCRKSPV